MRAYKRGGEPPPNRCNSLKFRFLCLVPWNRGFFFAFVLVPSYRPRGDRDLAGYFRRPGKVRAHYRGPHLSFFGRYTVIKIVQLSLGSRACAVNFVLVGECWAACIYVFLVRVLDGYFSCFFFLIAVGRVLFKRFCRKGSVFFWRNAKIFETRIISFEIILKQNSECTQGMSKCYPWYLVLIYQVKNGGLFQSF